MDSQLENKEVERLNSKPYSFKPSYELARKIKLARSLNIDVAGEIRAFLEKRLDQLIGSVSTQTIQRESQ